MNYLIFGSKHHESQLNKQKDFCHNISLVDEWDHVYSSTQHDSHSMCYAHANETSQLILYPNPNLNPNYKKGNKFVARDHNINALLFV